MAPGERQERVRMESGGSQEGVRRIESGGSQEGVRRESGSMSHGAWGQALDRMFLRAQYANPGGVSLASPHMKPLEKGLFLLKHKDCCIKISISICKKQQLLLLLHLNW